MDINKPVENPKLVDIMNRMKENRATQEEFFMEFENALFLCPADIVLENSTQEGNEIVVGEGTTISISHIEDNEGNKYLMAFTDWNELRKWSKEEIQTLVFSHDDYKKILGQEDSEFYGMVINPFGENIVMTSSSLTNSDKQEQVISKSEQVMVGIPKEYPTEMIDKLCRYFSRINKIKKAYLLWMVRGEEGSYLLVLDTLVQPKDVYPQIGELCRPFLDGKALDMIPINSEFGRNVIENQEPFYSSK